MFIDDVKFYKAKSLMFYNVGQPIQLSWVEIEVESKKSLPCVA